MPVDGSAEELLRREVHGQMRGVAEHLRLPLSRRSWRGQAGNWLGAGIGSSIDFQDHRPYLPGDDPRYIDWSAFARTGQYTMKLYREEVSPNVDILMDVSESMRLHPTKHRRALELLYFTVESALQAGAAIRCSLVSGNEVVPVPVDALLAYRWSIPTATSEGDRDPVAWNRLPFRHGSMRVWISDLLFPGAPDPAMKMLTANRGSAIIFAPYDREEQEPGWQGNIELIDCESGRRRKQKAPPELMRRYADAYRRHFAMWADRCRQFGVALAQLPAEGDFVAVLAREGMPAQVVETWN